MEPSETLSTTAQIAVALAGFADVVVVFRRESVHDWSAIDKFRLRLLLTNSILPLALCVIGLLLAGTRGNLALVQRRRGRNSFAVCDYNIQTISQTGSAAVTKCALLPESPFTSLGSWESVRCYSSFSTSR
jgi:hypothetical protein